MKKMSRRTALKVMGAGILGLTGMAAWNRDQIIAFLDRDAAAHEAGDDSVQVKRRLYPSSGTELSLLGFGAMRLPTRHGEIDEELAQKMVDYAYRHGVNYYDTAYMYHGGESEAFIGRALSKYPRESYFLVDKMPTFMITDPADVPQIFEEQLRRCRTTYFDNYLLHSLSSRADFERIYLDGGGLDYLRQQKAVGRIRYLGFSFHGDPPFFDYIMDNFTWDCVMIQLNYLDWNEPDEAPDGARQGGSLYRKAMEKNTPCFVMEPVKGGRLADISSSAESVLRARQPDWSPAAWALRYVASFPGVVTLLSGMSTLAQVVENVQTMADFEPLTPVERHALAMSQGKGTGSAINCTYCRYCDPCPYGVDIAGTFHVYNTWAERLHLGEGEDAAASDSERTEFLRHYHNEVAKKARADMCIHCNECLPKCPQHLPIPDLLAKVNQLAGASGRKGASA